MAISYVQWSSRTCISELLIVCRGNLNILKVRVSSNDARSKFSYWWKSYLLLCMQEYKWAFKPIDSKFSEMVSIFYNHFLHLNECQLHLINCKLFYIFSCVSCCCCFLLIPNIIISCLFYCIGIIILISAASRYISIIMIIVINFQLDIYLQAIYTVILFVCMSDNIVNHL